MSYGFKVGDWAVYPAHGVAEVTGIESREVSGNTETFYMLRLLDTDRTIMVPLSKVPQVGLRPVVDRKDVPKVFDALRNSSISVSPKQAWNRRYRAYVEKLKNGTIYDIADVMKDLYMLRYEKSLSYGEKRLLETAKGLFVKEIAVATSQSEEEVEKAIEELFSSPEEELEQQSA